MSQTIPLSKIRILANHMLSLSQYNCFPISMSMEFNAESFLKYKKDSGFSLTSVLTKTIADVFTENPDFKVLNSYLLKSPFVKSRLVLFDDISFSIALPKVYKNEEVATLYILEIINKKTIQMIDGELKAANEMKITEMPFFAKMQKLLNLPSLFYSPLFTLLKWFPRRSLVAGSSLGLTNLGQSPIQTVFPVSPKTLIFGLGGSYSRLVNINETLTPQRHMTLSFTFNHYVVDGRICSEFMKCLKMKLENLNS